MTGPGKPGKALRLSRRDRMRLRRWFKRQMVNHRRLKAVRSRILELFEDDDPAAIVIVTGPAGVGKTSLLESLRRAFGKRCLYLEARSPDGRAYDNREHCRLLLEQLGDPAPDEHFDPEEAAARRRAGHRRPAVGRRATLSDLRLALVRALPAAGIECVLIDEAQHMFNAVSGPRLHQQMDHIKSMSNLSGVRHVLAGSPELLTLLELTPQVAPAVLRRPGSPRTVAIARRTAHSSWRPSAPWSTGSRCSTQRELSAEFEYVFENTAGCVGPLKDWLRRALARALRKGLPAVDGKVLRKTVLEPGAVQAIADDTDMRDGLSDRHWTPGREVCHRSPSGTDGGRKRGATPRASGNRASIRWRPRKWRPDRTDGTITPFALHPRGVGTPAAESLSSYLVRLAGAQVLPTATFAARHFAERGSLRSRTAAGATSTGAAASG